MSPLTHFMGSWLVASVTMNNPRDRRLVTLAGIIPDADGLGMVADVVKSLVSGQELAFPYYQRFHHLWLHGWPGALLAAVLLASFGRQRLRVGFWCLVVFHLHLLCDLAGSRGPSSADLWPICYGEPLFRHPIWFWKGQWKLDGLAERESFSSRLCADALPRNKTGLLLRGNIQSPVGCGFRRNFAKVEEGFAK